MRRISILGSTGSIGRNALDVIRHLPPDEVEVVGLAARRSVERIVQQALSFSVKAVALAEEEAAKQAARMLKGTGVQVFGGQEGVLKIAAMEEADMILSAMVGSAGLIPTLEAIRSSKDVAFANKEVLVVGGEIVMEEVKRKRVRFLPVDSEISAIFQCLEGRDRSQIKRLILTASGGPFRRCSWEELEKVTVQQALKHPRWKMGSKVTIDSATLMNKGFEVIESMWLFGVDLDKIDVLVHPQSVVHSMVEFVDGAIIAQMSVPDMRIPIQYALTYPRRMPTPAKALDLAGVGELTFEEPDPDRFPCLKLAYEAAEVGGTMPAVLSAADEVAVNAFLQGRIDFTDIPKLIKTVMDRHTPVTSPSVSDLLEADRWAKREAEEILKEGGI